MIHIATVHHRSSKWIDVQLEYLHRHIAEPFRVIANLEGVDRHHEVKFDRVINAIGRHAGKLNLLAAEIVAEAKGDDIIIFLDGDAFPICDPMPLVRQAIDSTGLVAVLRRENGEDQQPHPSFCAVRVSTWDHLRGDWSMGHPWQDEHGNWVSDSGGNLLAALERHQNTWTPLLRTNRVNLHPLWFGIYGGIVYHHGAGFRKPVARSFATSHPARWRAGEQAPLIGTPIRKFGSYRVVRWERREFEASRRLGDQLFSELSTNPDFYRQFL